ncbi:DUF488 domain-containing protein [Jidongwangia harbinensis]|uniref:DUF488 domain-containing protein n=1 Tax=Jidongwangia harbinensis TaxID=2878561 RepID=UPI001CD9428F|nr:DUF488 domain-containing protein [Jidongwangia harbinensis]MCA2218880.1 DUF488 domain-containing protein [Jidongwangia harbinensis]
MATLLMTVGHGTATEDELVTLFRGAGLRRLTDVRRYPGSRAHPHVSRDRLVQWLPACGISYRHEERLGGRRRLDTESPDSWWKVAAFRAYAGHMRSTEFLEAIDQLTAEFQAEPTAIMCSESLWWRCHRRLVADFLTIARGLTVCHLDHHGRLAQHRVSGGARLTPGGLLCYDTAVTDS